MSRFGKLIGGLFGKAQNKDAPRVEPKLSVARIAPHEDTATDPPPLEIAEKRPGDDPASDNPVPSERTDPPSDPQPDTPPDPPRDPDPAFPDPADVLRALGDDLDRRDAYESTQLHRAAERGDLRLLEALLHARASANLPDGYTRTALEVAAMKGRREIVSALLARCAGLQEFEDMGGDRALFDACNCGHTAIAETLLDAGGARWINAQNRHHMRWTPLFFAAKTGDAGIVNMLLGRGAEVDLQDSEGRTPLLWAGRESYRKPATARSGSLSALLAAGADPNIHDELRMSPLFHAAAYGDVTAVRELLEAGADPDVETITGLRAAAIATANGHTDVVEALRSAPRTLPVPEPPKPRNR